MDASFFRAPLEKFLQKTAERLRIAHRQSTVFAVEAPGEERPWRSNFRR